MFLKQILLTILRASSEIVSAFYATPEECGISSVASDSHTSIPERKNVIGEHIFESGFYQSIELTNEPPIVHQQSIYQNITIVRSQHYGKILVLDGVLQLTEKDADSYNEMMTHPAMFAHPSPKRVLVVGGGDGYVLHEVLKHPSVEHVDHVDLDKDVIDVCHKHFPWGHVWDDPRVTLHITDGASFIKNAVEGYYDVIIQDSSDPETWDEHGQEIDLPSKVLYEMDHFTYIYRALSSKGVFNFQAESFGIASDLDSIVEWRKQTLAVGFQLSRYGSLSISSYPTGQIGFLLCQKDAESALDSAQIRTRYEDIVNSGNRTSYYHPKLQESAFVLPLWVDERIYPNS